MNWNQILISIDNNIENEMTVNEIAKAAGYSEYYFIRRFKEYMGLSVMEYVQKRRLIKASEEILRGQKIIDVAIKYGWQSHSGFTRAFKKEFGFHPSLLKLLEISEGGCNIMSHVFLESTEVGMKKEQLFAILKGKMGNSKYVEEAYTCACIAYRNVMRYSGEEYVTHPLNVAILLTELEAEEKTILAGMFCDVERKGKVSIAEFKENLPEETIEIIHKLHADEIDWEDERVLLIKLAERLHNMRTIEYMGAEARGKKAKETIEYFLPLAKKIVNKKLLNELNDLAIKYL